MKRLTPSQKFQAYLSILPNDLKLKDNSLRWDSFLEYSKNDLGRGMLENDKFCLMESLTSYKNNPSDFEIITEKVCTSLVDDIVTTMSLKFFGGTKSSSADNSFGLLIPPTSYAYPLLIAYHLVLQHVAESLRPTLGLKFEENKGILIISDNVELLSRICRTNISEKRLSQFINTYTIKSNEFVEFTFNERIERIENINDGTLPWLCLYRAVSRTLPNQLSKTPELVIIDLLPFRHRKRAKEIINWAKANAKQVIVVAPLHQDEIYDALKNTLSNILPIDRYITQFLFSQFEQKKTSTSNLITEPWSISPSLRFLKHSTSPIQIIYINGIEKLDEAILSFLSIIKHSFAKDGSQSKAFKRLFSTFNQLINLAIPLAWYERIRKSEGKITLLDEIDLCDRIPGQTAEEEKINHSLLPTAVRFVKDIYSLLEHQDTTPRAEAIKKVLLNNVNKKVRIICSDKVVAAELKIWIRVKTDLKASDLKSIQVFSQDDWARNQLRGILFNSDEEPEVTILANVWKYHHLSSFYFSQETELYFISLKHEERLVRHQIKEVTMCRESYVDDFIKIAKDAANVNVRPELINHINRTPIIVKELTIRQYGKSEQRQVENNNLLTVSSLFDEKAFLLMFQNLSSETEIDEAEQMERLYTHLPIVEDNSERHACVSIVGAYGEQDAEFRFLLPTLESVKVVRFGVDEVISIKPIELQVGDFWIKVKNSERRELFEEILQLASNTLTMKWITSSVSEWREMLSVLWNRYYSVRSPKKYTYEKILNEVRRHGGSVETTYSISNWIKGEVTSVKDGKNVMAVALILGEKQYIDRWKVIHLAMRQLWNIHIQLGRTLTKIVRQQAVRRYGDEGLASDWVDLGLDIRISVQDIVNTLSFVRITGVNYDDDFYTFSEIAGKPLSDVSFQKLLEKGWIGYDSK